MQLTEANHDANAGKATGSPIPKLPGVNVTLYFGCVMQTGRGATPGLRNRVSPGIDEDAGVWA